MSVQDITSNQMFIFSQISKERRRQDEKFGKQNYRMVYDGFDVEGCKKTLEIIRRCNKKAGKIGKDNWYYILAEEFLEAFAETEPVKQREEMIQVAAVAVNIIECLDRRIGNERGLGMKAELKEMLKPPFKWIDGNISSGNNEKNLLHIGDNLLFYSDPFYETFMDFVEQALNEKWERDFGEPLRWKQYQNMTSGYGYVCPKCGADMCTVFNYCPHCGQRLLPPKEGQDE